MPYERINVGTLLHKGDWVHSEFTYTFTRHALILHALSHNKYFNICRI
jgi:hypothetical protein